MAPCLVSSLAAQTECNEAQGIPISYLTLFLFTGQGVSSTLGNPSVSWSEKEDSTIRRLWPQASKEELLAALPIRSWTGLRHRASRLKVRRIIDRPNTHELPETVNWQDMAVMSLYNVTEEMLRKEN